MTPFRPAERAPYVPWLLAAVWVALILYLTLTPASGIGTSAGPARSADAVRNLILFTPLGLLLGVARQPITRVAAFAALLSMTVELLQLGIPGRHPGLRDIVTNTTGAAVGAAFARALLGPVFRSPVHSARLALLMGILGALIVLLPGALLRAAPPETRYFTALRPDYPRYGVFPGRVLDAQLGDQTIRTEAPSPHSAALRERLLDGSTLEIRALAERRSAEIAPLVRFNDGSWEVLMTGVQNDDLVIRRHALAGELGLEEPLFRWPDALPPIGRPFHVALVPSGVGWLASIDGAAPRRIGPSPALARRLLADSDAFSNAQQRTLDGLMFTLLFAAIAVWVRARAAAVAGMLLSLGAVSLAPSLVGVLPSPAGEWAGIGIGLALGGLLQIWLRRGASGATPGPQGPRA